MSTAANREATRSGIRGVAALDARLEPWMTAALSESTRLSALLDRYGSPVNLLDPSPMGRNAAELQAAATATGVDFRVFVARKANKALVLVDEARRLGLGVDVASERELQQTLDRGVPAEDIVVTAAVKPRPLLELCVRSGVTIVIDNHDELALLRDVADGDGPTVPIAIRLAPDLGPGRLRTRFGATEEEALAWASSSRADANSAPHPPRIQITGVHFHLDGYAAADRVTALVQALAFVDALRAAGHAPSFIDIGGGIPMRYLDDPAQWDAFWTAHRAGLLGERPSLTYDDHGLGLLVHDGAIVGRPNVYPAAQPLVRGEWLSSILEARPAELPETVAEAVRERGLQLRCEPGRSIMDGCGMTAARVVQRKQRRDGVWLIGLGMNRTQCRSTADDLLVDPLLVPVAAASGERQATPPIEGYLVGAYCIERELLTWRRMRFPDGIAVDDIVVFPNTAGYHMHILESASHQIPLAQNVVLADGDTPRLDDIDR